MGNARDVSTTVLKAVELLRAVARSKQGASLTELTAMTGLQKTVCHRLLRTLQQEALVERSSSNGSYRIGCGLIELAGSALGQNALRIQAARHLRDLARATGDVAMLFVPYGSHAMCIDRIDGDYPVKAPGVE